MSKRPLFYWNILGEGTRKARACQYRHISQDNNKLRRRGRRAARGSRACRFSKSDRPRSSEADLDAFTHVANEPVDVFNTREVADLNKHKSSEGTGNIRDSQVNPVIIPKSLVTILSQDSGTRT